LSSILLVSLFIGLGSELPTQKSRRVSPEPPHFFSIMPPWQAVLFYMIAWAILFSIFGYIVEETEWGYRLLEF